MCMLASSWPLAASDKRCIARTPLDAIPAKKRQLRCIESLVSNKFSVPLGCTQRNAPLALSECHLVAPSKLHAFSGSTEMMKKFPARVPAGQFFGRKKAQAKIELKDRIAPQVNFIQSSEKVVEVARRKKKGKRRWWRVDHFESCM